MAGKKNKKTPTSYWLVPAVLTVLIGCAVMWYWSQQELKGIEEEEQSIVLPTSGSANSASGSGEVMVKGTSTSQEIDAMFKRLEQTSTTDDLSDLK